MEVAALPRHRLELGRALPRHLTEGGIGQRVFAAKAKQEAVHLELIALMRAAMEPARDLITWATLRRVLALSGYRRATRTAHIAAALCEAFPGAVLSIAGTRHVIRNVSLRPDHLKRLKAQLTATWEKRLGITAEIQPIESRMRYGPDYATPGSRLAHLIASRVQRQRDASAYYDVACEYLWTNRWGDFPELHRRVWELHSLDGMTVRDIGAEVQHTIVYIHEIISKHRARCGITHGTHG